MNPRRHVGGTEEPQSSVECIADHVRPTDQVRPTMGGRGQPSVGTASAVNPKRHFPPETQRIHAKKLRPNRLASWRQDCPSYVHIGGRQAWLP